MRRFVSLLLVALVTQVCLAKTLVAAKTIQQSQATTGPLTNQDILTLVNSGLATEIVVAKVQRLGCSCDTSTAELQRLRAEGVPDDVLVAMIYATKVGHNDDRPISVRIPGGTRVDIETAYRISSQEVKPGEAISFRVVNPVKIGEILAIAPGATATGRVIRATRGAHFGRAGRLAWTMETVTAVDGTPIPIQASGGVVGDSKGAKVATQIVLMGVILGPLAPAALLFGFKRGENAYIAQGRRYEVLVSSNATIKVNSNR